MMSDESGISDNELALDMITLSPLLSISNVLAVFVNILTLVFTKDYGDVSIYTGVGLALSIQNFCFMGLYGMTMATLSIGANFYGSNNYAAVGYTFYRSLIANSLVAIPLAFLMYCTEPLLLLFLHKNDDATMKACKVAGLINEISTLQIPVVVLITSYTSYLNSIGITGLPTVSVFVRLIFMVVLDVVFVYEFHWDYFCLSWALVASIFIQLLVLIATTFQCPEVLLTFQDFNVDAVFSTFYNYLCTALTMAGVIVLDISFFEVMIPLATSISVDAGAAFITGAQLAIYSCNFIYGVSVITQIKVSYSIGERNAKEAFRRAHIGIILALATAVVIAGIVIGFGGFYVKYLNLTPEGEKLALQILPIVALLCILDAVSFSASYILNAVGHETYSLIIAFVTFYTIGIPLAFVVTLYYKISIIGIFISMLIAYFTRCVLSVGFIYLMPDNVFAISTPNQGTDEDVHETLLSGKFD